MTRIRKAAVKVDFYGVQPRLLWANEREVEPQFLKVESTYGGQETVVWFLVEGAVTLTYPQASVRVEKGRWVFLRAENARQQFTRGARLVSLRFHLRLRGGKPLFARRRDVVLEGSDHPLLAATAMALVAESRRVRGQAHGALWVARERLDLVDNFRIEAAFMAWLGAYVEAMEGAGEAAELAGERDERAGKALALIEDHRMRDKFSEPELARRCGLSVNQLGRVFRREMGMSPFQYYETRRLELARHALAESRLPVKEIGFELGFSSSSHFSNWFTERGGVSPRGYRRRETAG